MIKVLFAITFVVNMNGETKYYDAGESIRYSSYGNQCEQMVNIEAKEIALEVTRKVNKMFAEMDVDARLVPFKFSAKCVE